jgi:hypothetical protein
VASFSRTELLYARQEKEEKDRRSATQGNAVEAESMSRSGSANVDVKKADSGGKKKKNRKQTVNLINDRSTMV